jgi:hypothetical protein
VFPELQPPECGLTVIAVFDVMAPFDLFENAAGIGVNDQSQYDTLFTVVLQEIQAN